MRRYRVRDLSVNQTTITNSPENLVMLHARCLTYSVHILLGISVVLARAMKSLKPNVALSAEALVGRARTTCQELQHR